MSTTDLSGERQSELYAAAADMLDDITEYLDGGGSPDISVRLRGDMPARPLLIAAALNGRALMVRLLLDRGAAVDACSEDGYTALLAAASKDHEIVVAQLLRAGADRTRTRDGMTAAQLAQKRSVIALLAGERTAESVLATLTEDLEPLEASDGDDELTVAKLEAHYDRALPAVYAELIATGAYKRYADKRFPIVGRREPIRLRFDGDVYTLLEDAGDHDHDEARDLLPLAAFVPDAADFLLIDIATPGCPVVLYDHAVGFRRVADGLVAFLATAR